MRALLLVFLLYAAWLPAQRLAAQTASDPSDAIWAYTDDRGRLVHCQQLDDVPLRLRAQAQRVDQSEPPVPKPGFAQTIEGWLEGDAGKPAAAPAALDMYRYRGPGGRMVYTNVASSVPAAQRAGARIDLAQVPLNSELGTDLNRELARQHHALQDSSTCAALRAANEEAWWARAWHEHTPLVVCGGALFLAVLMTPWMLRRGWGANWAKVLSTATPVLGFVGVAAFLLLQTQRSMSDASVRASRCESRAFLSAPTLTQRAQLVQALQAEQRALAQIHAESQ